MPPRTVFSLPPKPQHLQQPNSVIDTNHDQEEEAEAAEDGAEDGGGEDSGVASINYIVLDLDTSHASHTEDSPHLTAGDQNQAAGPGPGPGRLVILSPSYIFHLYISSLSFRYNDKRQRLRHHRFR